ncbi:MAG TPA: protoporphyrinogen oxidase [Dissulfurispiraceae bacterium]|nr:protoporphyrinogen oxidase [Dissulfurispiraceae bacterium]
MRIAIVGGGISGLSLAYALFEKKHDADIKVFEAENRPGGKIYTEKVDGYVCEAGVNGFLDNKPSTLELAGRINLPPVKSNDNARKRFIYSDGMLRQIPDSAMKFFMSNFLSLSGRARMIGEYFVPPSRNNDETLESFAVRRVGREFYEKLLDPMASGVYAGDPTKMSIRSCFAKVYDLEQKYGGLIRGFMALGKEAKRAGKKVEAGPGGTLMSFSGGMYSIIETLKSLLGDKVETGKAAAGIEKIGSGYRLHFKDGSAYEADCLVLACPAIDSAEIVRDFDKEICGTLRTIPYPPLSVVSFGYKREKIHRDINLFGYLIPGKERRRILGTLFDSSIFENRAPEGYVLLRNMVGGARAERFAILDDEKLIGLVRDELAAIMGLMAEPDFVRVFRWERAIPQYLVGHYRKLETLDDASARHDNFHLTGNAYRGVAVNDCIANSYKLAEEIAKKATWG